MEVHGLDSEWQSERNCFKDYAAHLAFQAWQSSREKLADSLRAKEQAEWLGSRGFHAGWTGAARFALETIK